MVDALWAIKKKFQENDFWVFAEHKVQMITEKISRCWYWQSVAMPPLPQEGLCFFPSNCILFSLTQSQYSWN